MSINIEWSTCSELNNIITTWKDSLYKNKIVDRPKHFIHYTGLKKFYAMMKDFTEENKNYITLFASQIQYLNDSKEFSEGVEFIKIQEPNFDSSKVIDKAFVNCFCGEEDLLSQWKYYGKESGIAMEFDFFDSNFDDICDFLWVTDNSNNEMEIENFSMKKTPIPVFYNEEKREKAYDLIKEAINICPSLRSMVKSLFIPYCKNAAFYEESESRLLFYPIVGELNSKIKYYTTNNKIIPQLEVKAFYKEENAENKPPIPLKNIMIGPGYNQIPIFNSVINLLEKENKITGYIDDKNFKSLEDLGEINELKIGELKNVIKEKVKYVTYRTSTGITVQLSAIPFRS